MYTLLNFIKQNLIGGNNINATILHVNIQRCTGDTAFLAAGTHVRAFARVASHVYLEGAGLVETSSAMRALVGFFSGVNTLVHHQVITFGEGFRTEAALERFLAGVDAIVQFHFVFRRKTFTAHVA